MFEDWADVNWVVVLGMWLIVVVMIWKAVMWQGENDPIKIKIAATILMLPITYLIVYRMSQ